MTLFRTLALIYGSALITAFFSEMHFFNEGPAYTVIGNLEDPLHLIGHLAELALWYCVVMAPVLWVIQHFNVRNIWALFLTGCVFGLFTEGLVIPAIYFELPFSILWTALSWHPLSCFLIGWCGVRLVLQRGRVIEIVPMLVALGLLWGIWPTNLIGKEIDQEVASGIITVGELFEPVPFHQFLAFGLISTTMWFLGNVIVDRVALRDYRPGKLQSGIIGAISLLAFAAIVAQVQVLAGVLVVMTALIWLGLRRNRKAEARDNILSAFRPIPWWAHFSVYLTPLTAAFTYDLWVSNGWQVEGFLIALPIVVIGAGLFVLSFIRLFMMPRLETAT